MDFWRFSRFVHGNFGSCILQSEIETEGIFDSERNGNKADMDSVRVCMWACMLCVRDMHRRVGAGVQVLCGYVCVQV